MKVSLRRIALLLALSLSTWACGFSIANLGKPDPNVLGFAGWVCPDAAPFSVVKSRLLFHDPVMAVAVALHEIDHEEYMVEVASSCAEWNMKATMELRYDMEARGFCVMAKYLHHAERFETLEDAVTVLAGWLADYPQAKRLKYTQRDARARIGRYCGV